MSALIIWDGFEGGFLEVDVTVSESHKADAKYTRFPVEQGIAVTDHRRLEPRELEMSGVITNTPLTTDGTEYPFSDPGRAEQAWAGFLHLRDSGDLVDVVTVNQRYNGYGLESFVVTRAPKVGHALQFSAKFVEVLFVQTQQVQLKVKKPRAKKKVDDGKKGTKPVETPVPTSELYLDFAPDVNTH